MHNTNSAKTALITLCLGYFMVIIDVTVVNVALPSIARSLGAEISSLQWIIDGYALSFACLLLLAGNLADKLGAKRLFLMGLILFVVTSLGCGLATSIEMLILARILQGIGAAFMVPSSLSLINTTFDHPAARAKAIGIWGGVGGIAAALGPILGALLTAGFSWRAVFFINIPIGLLAIYFTCTQVRPLLGNKMIGIDVPGQILACVWIGALAFTLIEAGKLGWSSATVLMSLSIFIISLIVFIWLEIKVKAPMFPFAFLASSHFSIPLCLGVFINISTYGLLFLLPLYFQEIRHYSVLMTGFSIVPLFILVAVSSYVSGRCVTRYGIKTVIALGLLVGILGFLGMWWAINLSNPRYIEMILPLLCIGFGIAFSMPAATIAIIRSVESSRAGLAAASFNMMRQLGTLIGVALFGMMVAVLPPFVLGMSLCLCIAAGVYMTALVIVYYI